MDVLIQNFYGTHLQYRYITSIIFKINQMKKPSNKKKIFSKLIKALKNKFLKKQLKNKHGKSNTKTNRT